MSAALWYPIDNKPWHGSSHYSINCDWISLDISGGGSLLDNHSSSRSWNASSAFSLLFSMISLCLSGYMMYRLYGPRGQYKGMSIVADEMELQRSWWTFWVNKVQDIHCVDGTIKKGHGRCKFHPLIWRCLQLLLYVDTNMF